MASLLTGECKESTAIAKAQDYRLARSSSEELKRYLSELRVPSTAVQAYAEKLDVSLKSDASAYEADVKGKKADFKKKNGLWKTFGFKPPQPEPSTQTRCLELIVNISKQIEANIAQMNSLPETIAQIELKKYDLEERRQELHKKIKSYKEWFAYRDLVDSAAAKLNAYDGLPDSERQSVADVFKRETNSHGLNLKDPNIRLMLSDRIISENQEINRKIPIDLQFIEDSYLAVLEQLKILETFNNEEVKERILPAFRNTHKLKLAYDGLALAADITGMKVGLNRIIDEASNLLKDASDVMRFVAIENDLEKQVKKIEREVEHRINPPPPEKDVKERIDWLLGLENQGASSASLESQTETYSKPTGVKLLEK